MSSITKASSSIESCIQCSSASWTNITDIQKLLIKSSLCKNSTNRIRKRHMCLKPTDVLDKECFRKLKSRSTRELLRSSGSSKTPTTTANFVFIRICDLFCVESVRDYILITENNYRKYMFIKARLCVPKAILNQRCLCIR